MRPLLRRAIKVCRQEGGMPPLVKIELLLRQARKVCRQGGVVPPSVEIKMSLRHYDMLEKYVDKNQGNGCPPNGVPTLFSMGGATVFLELEQPKCTFVPGPFQTHCDFSIIRQINFYTTIS